MLDPPDAARPEQPKPGAVGAARPATRRQSARRDRLGDPRRRGAGDPHDLAAGAAHVQPHRARPRRPGAHRLGDRLGRTRDAAQPAAPVRLKRLLPASPEPGLLGLAARLRPGGILRLGHSRCARPLQPAVPVRLVAVLRRRLSARARAGRWASVGGAVAGVAFAYAPYGSPRPGTCTSSPAAASRWRCSCCCAATAALARRWCSRAGWWRPGRSASVSRWDCSSPICWRCCADRAVLVAGAATGAPSALLALLSAALVLVTCLGDRPAWRGHRLPGSPLSEGRLRVPDRQAHAERSRELLLRAGGAAVGLLGEPGVGRSDCGRARRCHSKNEDVFFPGLAIVVLALIGLAQRLALHAALAHRPAGGIVVVLGAGDGTGVDRSRLPLPAAL